MSTGNKVIIFVLVIIITIFGIFLILSYLKNTKMETNFNNLIVEIDSLIFSGYLDFSIIFFSMSILRLT